MITTKSCNLAANLGCKISCGRFQCYLLDPKVKPDMAKDKGELHLKGSPVESNWRQKSVTSMWPSPLTEKSKPTQIEKRRYRPSWKNGVPEKRDVWTNNPQHNAQSGRGHEGIKGSDRHREPEWTFIKSLASWGEDRVTNWTLQKKKKKTAGEKIFRPRAEIVSCRKAVWT